MFSSSVRSVDLRILKQQATARLKCIRVDFIFL
jgi:hypothetical protein